MTKGTLQCKVKTLNMVKIDKDNPLLVSAAILIGSLVISTSVLISGGVIRFKKPGSTTTTTTTTPTASINPSGTLEDKLISIAKSQGLDENQFKSCLSSQKYQDEISKDESDAQAATIQGTPGFIVGKTTADGKISGVKISGAYPFTTFKSVIDQLKSGSSIETVLKSDDTLEAGTATIDDDPILGQKDAELTIIEFSDYECPFCKRHFLQTYPEIKSNYIDKGDLRLVYRDYIAVPSHNPAATTEAIAANCVKELGGDEAYFKFHDAIFSQTKANGGGL